jgi:hypothetical protein
MLVVLPQKTRLAIPAKVFEYARFPAWVLALAETDSATADVLRENVADIVASSDTEGIAAVIGQRFDEWRGGVRARPLTRFTHLSRQTQARLLFDAIELLTASSREVQPTGGLEQEGTRIPESSDFPPVAARAVHKH